MDLGALKEARSLMQSREAQRDQRASQAFSEALGYLSKFEASSDQERLLKAIDALEQSLRFKSNQALPYALLASIFHSLGQAQMAIRYYKFAQNLQADLPLLKEIKHRFTRGNEFVSTVSPQSVVKAGDEQDEDALCQILEEGIHQLRLALVKATSNPTLKSEELRRIYHNSQIEYADLEKQLGLLGQQLEVSDLSISLQVLARCLSKLGRQHAAQLQKEGLLERIVSLQREVETQIQASRLGKPCSQQALESLLDACDQIADQLDAQEAAGNPIDGIMPAYQTLISQLEKLQDVLDD